MRIALLISLSLYVVAQQTSMAGMELFGWLTVLIGTISFFIRHGSKSFSIIKNEVIDPKLDISLLAFFVVIALGLAFFSPNELDRMHAFGTARWIPLFFFIRLALHQFEFESAKPLIFFCVGLTAVIGGYCVFQYYTGLDLIRSRNTLTPVDLSVTAEAGVRHFRSNGMFSMPTTFAHSMAIWLCLPIALLLTNLKLKSTQKILIVVSIMSGVIGLLLSLTRGAYLSLPIAVIVMAAFVSRQWLIRILVTIVFAGVLAVGFVPEIRQRAASITQMQGNTSNDQRKGLWRANIEIFKDNALFGIGYNLNEDTVDPYLVKLGLTNVFRGNAHNTFLQILAGTGLFGFVAFVAFVLRSLMVSVAGYRNSPAQSFASAVALAALGAQVATHVGGLTDCNFKDFEVNHAIVFAMACAVSISKKNQSTKAIV